MARTDLQRWADLRSTRKRPFKAVRLCSCGNKFSPKVPMQTLCDRCIGENREIELAEIRYEKEKETSSDLLAAVSEETLRRQLRRKSDEEIINGRSRAENFQAQRHSKALKGVHKKDLRPKHTHKPTASRKTHPNKIVHIVLKRTKAGHSPRNIAKMLGISVDVVREILDQEDHR